MLQLSGSVLIQSVSDGSQTADKTLTDLKTRRDAVEAELLRLRVAYSALPDAATPEALGTGGSRF